MEARYILLLGVSNGSLEARLRMSGMLLKLSSNSAKLFVSKGIDALPVGEHQLIIGRIFDKTGKRKTESSTAHLPSASLNQHLLENRWGEYLKIHLDERETTLLRDPSGAVPCFYSLTDGRGFITSDVALAFELGLHHRSVDWGTIAHGLEFPYLKSEKTGLTGISELLPGGQMRINERGLSVSNAWTPWNFVSGEMRQTDHEVAAVCVRDAVTMAVASLAASHDRFIVEISGGLDSSIVSICLRESARNAQFCTLVMAMDGTDERPYARLVTDRLGQDLSSIDIDLDDIHFEHPVPASSTLPPGGMLQNAASEAWKSAGRRHDVDSFFSGGGGDSIFCYLTTAAPAADAFIERGLHTGFSALRNLSSLHQCTIWKATRLTYRKIRQRQRVAWKRNTDLLSPSILSGNCHVHPWMKGPEDALPGDQEKIHQLISTQLFRPSTTRGDGRALHFPLLTQPVMEACLRVPTWMWISNGRNRAVARDAFAEQLPEGIVQRRSKGSYSGVLAGVYARHQHAIRDFLMDGALAGNGLLDCSALEHVFAAQRAPRDTTHIRILDLCAAENWVRKQL
jgi:asparagine synthase (glutamine-hydrolysing)